MQFSVVFNVQTCRFFKEDLYIINEKDKKEGKSVEQIQEQQEQKVVEKASTGSLMQRVREQKKIEP